MTIPTLLNDTQDKQYKVAYKKAYSEVNQAFLMMRVNDELVDTSSADRDDLGTTISPNCGENFKIMSKYFKVIKQCFNSNADLCWECDGGEAGMLNGTGSPQWLGCRRTNYAFSDAAGRHWYMYSNTEWPILVDVNGFKKPNRLGVDRFVFKFSDQNDNNYTSNATLISPWEDAIIKERWCPSGNCLYKSWLFD